MNMKKNRTFYAYADLLIVGAIFYGPVVYDATKEIVTATSKTVKAGYKNVKWKIHDVKRNKEIAKLEEMWNA